MSQGDLEAKSDQGENWGWVFLFKLVVMSWLNIRHAGHFFFANSSVVFFL